MSRIAILHPTDPLGNVPGGIDSFIKGILKWAPDDLEYTIFGASSDTHSRPLGKEQSVSLGDSPNARYIPIVSTNASGARGALPLTVRYMSALARYVRWGNLKNFDVLDFHRVEPVFLFNRDPRPKNVTFHTDYAILRGNDSDIMWRYWPWLYEQLEARAFRALDHVFTVRQTAVDRYIERFPEFAHKFSFIPTWMDADVFKPVHDDQERHALRSALRDALGVSQSSRILVSVGRLDHSKDPILLLRAFHEALSREANLHLVMIGDGVLRNAIKEFCQSNKLENQVSLLGTRSSNEIANILQSSDLFVLSSAYEGMCIAVLEALAVGLPVVSTDVGEINRVLKNGLNGQISRDRSPRFLADAICMSLDRLDLIRGEPCSTAVISYQPELVLENVYENHRCQAAMVRHLSDSCT